MSASEGGAQLDELKRLFENADSTTDLDPSSWMKSIRDKLFTMFCSPLKDEYYQEAFKWVSQICLTVGDLSWITTEDTWTKDDVKMFSCIAKLTINEVRILLPLIERHLLVGDEPEMEDGKVLARSADPSDYDRFGYYLVIIESTIKTLVKNQDLDEVPSDTKEFLTDVLDPQELQSLLDQLKSLMKLICDYLEIVHRHWQQILETQGDKLSSAEGALRIISVWLSEDPGSFDSECNRFLLELIVNSLNLHDRSIQHDLYILALHSCCASDEQGLRNLRKIPGHREALEKYLLHIEKEKEKEKDNKRRMKVFKLRCGLVKDLLSDIS